MLTWLRRVRLLPLVLLLATPGIGGNIVQAIHTCPVEAPWLAQQDAPSAGHHHGRHGSEPASADCQCIGACLTASPGAAPAGGPTVALGVTETVVVNRPAHLAVAPAAWPERFLPPATAPPVA